MMIGQLITLGNKHNDSGHKSGKNAFAISLKEKIPLM